MDGLKVVALEQHLLTPAVRAAWAGVDMQHQDDAVDYWGVSRNGGATGSRSQIVMALTVMVPR